ncbi:MAG TPA: EAL domain-containing protein [Candidatus Obscuribacterales bacterium]
MSSYLSSEFLRIVLNTIPEGVAITTADEIVIFVNDAFSKVTGFQPDDILGKPMEVLRSGLQDDDFVGRIREDLGRQGKWAGEFTSRRKTGEVYPVWATINVITDTAGRVSNYVAVFTDLTSAKTTEDELYRLANFDPLTSLPNRKVFFEHLHQTLQRSAKMGTKCGVILLDLDRFKELNDTLGHSAGDQFLVEVAGLLTRIKREDDFVCRFGGDEFALIVDRIDSDLDLAILVERVASMLAEPLKLNEHELVPNAKIGVAVYPDDGQDADTLAKHADTALSSAKRSDQGSYQFYTQKMNLNVVKHFWVENNLRKAIGTEQIIPFFQPQLNLATGRPDETEVLIRWKHPVKGFVGPGEFVEIAEKTGLIDALTEQVLSSACAHLKRWRASGIPIRLLAVNLSGRTFSQKDLASKLKACVDRYALSPSDILIEITESAIMTQPESSAAIVRELKHLGFALAIDDFGTGYSSLSYVHQFKVDQVKIDRSFIINLASSAESQSIVKAIVAMCTSLGLETLAEGVETQEQLELLRRLGCNKVQGYLISKPLSAEEFEAFLRTRLG